MPVIPIGGPTRTTISRRKRRRLRPVAGRAAASARARRLVAGREVLLEELGVDVNIRDADGFTALHHSAARGDNAMIQYLVSRGADVMAVNRAGQTSVDIVNSPEQRTQPFSETIALLEKLGAKNNHNCGACK
jgi:ankyrin repeat protein